MGGQSKVNRTLFFVFRADRDDVDNANKLSGAK